MKMGSIQTPPASPGLYITGLASKYPPHLNGPEALEDFASKCYDTSTPAFQKLFAINRTSGIATRPSIQPLDNPAAAAALHATAPPTIADLDALFRAAGVALATHACAAALREAGVAPAALTHSVAVTCTNAGNPGYDLLVLQRLGAPATTDRALLHGVGCAGGLAALRTAANVALGAAARGQAARVLVFAAELCTANARCDLDAVARSAGGRPENIAPVLFSDGAAALVLCNSLAVDQGRADAAKFELVDWGHATLPGTYPEMGFMADPQGFRTVISKNVPRLTSEAIRPMFERMKAQAGRDDWRPDDFDWALHPGGRAILEAAQARLDITEEHLRASLDIYRTRGNSSSPTVLIVLDRLRQMGEGRDDVVACSFGPGLAIEMAVLRRCRG